MKTLLRLASGLLFAAPLWAVNVISGDGQNGMGKAVYPEFGDAVYEGHFRNGGWEGEGKLTVPDNFTYVGTFTGNNMTGTGTVTFASGDVYRGEVVAALMDGEGVYTFADGEKLAGVFRRGKVWQGEGYLPLGAGAFYRGSFAEGVFHGQGTARLENGNVYKGAFENGQMQGPGTMTLVNGDIYEGTFVAGELEGEGTLTAKSGAHFRGAFRKSLPHGYGVAKRPDGTYTGEWREGKRHGHGRFTDPKGVIQFSGQWENDEAKRETAEYLPLLEQIFSRTFRGFQSLTVNGKRGNLAVTLRVVIDEDYKIRGTAKYVVKIDERDYACEIAVAGAFNRHTKGMYYEEVRRISADVLPSGIQWLPAGGQTMLQLLNDNDHPGEYLLQGNSPRGDPIELGTYR